MLRHGCAMGLEGIVSKRRDAPYRSERADAPCSAEGNRQLCRKREEPGHDPVWMLLYFAGTQSLSSPFRLREASLT
jgi:hypothetical protein